MRSASARATSNVVQFADGIVEGADWPLVPDAEYLAVYQGHDCIEMASFRGAPKVFIRFKLAEAGPHTGKTLFRAYRVRRRIDSKRFAVGPRSELLAMICRVMDPPTRQRQISLRDLKRHLVRVRTRTVIKDGRQRDVPAAMRYSVIDEILGKETT